MAKKQNIKVRNEFVTALARRAGAGAGAHQKSKKAQRRSEKVSLRKQLS